MISREQKLKLMDEMNVTEEQFDKSIKTVKDNVAYALDNMGTSLILADNKESGAVTVSIMGSPDDICNLLALAFEEHPELMMIVLRAVKQSLTGEKDQCDCPNCRENRREVLGQANVEELVHLFRNKNFQA